MPGFGWSPGWGHGYQWYDDWGGGGKRPGKGGQKPGQNPPEGGGGGGSDWGGGGSDWGGGGSDWGGGGGGGAGAATLLPWAGLVPDQSWLGMGGLLPWSDWGQTPWANTPAGRSEEAMAWLNTFLPWYQQALAERQFQQQVDLQRELANVNNFGRRLRPNVRWL